MHLKFALLFTAVLFCLAQSCGAATMVCNRNSDVAEALVSADQKGDAIVLSGGPCRVMRNITLDHSIQVQHGGMIAPDAGVTVTLAVAPVDGLEQIFGGGGKIQFSSRVSVRPEWWGARGASAGHTNDDAPAIQAACRALPANSQTQRRLLSGDIARTGAVLFRPIVYSLRHTLTCSYGVRYYAEGGHATLMLASGVNPSGTESFILSIDPPAINGQALTNEAFGTVVDGLAFSGAGNSNISGLLFYGAQGAYLNDVSSQYTDTRGIVIFESPIEANRGTISASLPYLKSIGPAIEMQETTANFDVLDVADTNRSGLWRSVDVPASASLYSPRQQGSVMLDSTARILVRNLSAERKLSRPIYLKRVSWTPGQGEFLVTSDGDISFCPQDSNASKRVLFRIMPSPVSLAVQSQIPLVAALQVDAGSSVQVRSIFAEGNAVALRLTDAHGVGVNFLEAHPSEGAIAGHGAAAVVIDKDSTGSRLEQIKIFNPPSGKTTAIGYDFTVLDEGSGAKLPAKRDKVDSLFSYGSYRQ